MAGEWVEMSVAELQAAGALLVEDGNHGENRPRPYEFSTEGIQFIRAADMDSGRVLFERAQRINEVARERVRKGIGAGGDVLLSHKGTVGKIAYVPLDAPPFVCSPQTTFWRVKDLKQLDRRYIYFYLLSRAFREQLDSRKGETDMAAYVSLTTQRTLQVTVPPLADQQAIAAVLGALDDKIELNRRMNATLEAMARALFQSWFVDFDPVRAKLDGREPVGLDPATAALFPSSFHDTSLGQIPKCWKAGTVAESFNLTMGQSPPGDTYNEEGSGLPFYQGRTDFGFRFPTRRISCTAPSRYAKPGDTLVSVRAPVGDINMANEGCCIGRGVAAVRHKTGATSFTYYSMAILSPVFARFEAEGTVFGSINKDNFEKLPFVIPPDEVVAAYEKNASPLDCEIRNLEDQSRTLATLRDTLLPKLLSGKLSIN